MKRMPTQFDLLSMKKKLVNSRRAQYFIYCNCVLSMILTIVSVPRMPPLSKFGIPESFRMAFGAPIICRLFGSPLRLEKDERCCHEY